MQDKKHIDITSWKDRLDSPAEFPGELLADKNMAWEKLSDRLQTDRRPLTRYWIAAAILLLLTVSWLLLDRKNNEPVEARVQGYPDTASLSFHPPHQGSENKNIVALPADRQLLVAAPIKPQQHFYSHSRPAAKSHLVMALIQNDEKSPALVIAPSAETVVIALVVSKKKLPVIHINELGMAASPAQSQPVLAIAPWKTNSWLKIKNNASPNASPAGRQEDVRIKIPLTN